MKRILRLSPMALFLLTAVACGDATSNPDDGGSQDAQTQDAESDPGLVDDDSIDDSHSADNIVADMFPDDYLRDDTSDITPPPELLRM